MVKIDGLAEISPHPPSPFYTRPKPQPAKVLRFSSVGDEWEWYIDVWDQGGRKGGGIDGRGGGLEAGRERGRGVADIDGIGNACHAELDDLNTA